MTNAKNHPDSAPQDTELKYSILNDALGKEKRKRSNARCGDARYLVTVTSYRIRLCDEDNLIPKYFIDSLRYAGILSSDAPDKTHIVTTQTKVAKKDQEKTVIEIVIP